LSRGDPSSFLDQSKITYITPAEALKALANTDANYFLLDVQSAQNYQKKHLKGSVNIPLAELERRSKEIPAGRNILVYGESELSSFQGGVRLADLNVFTARTLSGNDHLKPESGFFLEP
ncbi:MAG: rhodanese-like domain-containing protein, partial [Candidatus Moraniibacteriota bacterium]